ncbi:MAG TPA: ADOP family duplicated permease [Longimicrobiales bacterium]
MQYRRRFHLQPRSPRDAEQDLTAEIEAHIAMRVEDLVAAGETAERAREKALARFGDQGALRATVRARDARLRRVEFLDELRQDAMLTWRRARHARGPTLLSVLTFALGIGLTTLMFTFVDRVLMRPLPYPDADRLVVLQGEDSAGSAVEVVSWSNWADWTENSRVLESSAVHLDTRFTISNGLAAHHENGALVSQDFFTVLRVPMRTGRGFVSEDEAAGAVVVSENFWRRELGGDRMVVNVDGSALPVVGVVRAGFEYPQGVAVWRLTRGLRGTGLLRNNINWTATARLSPDVTPAMAAAALTTTARGIQAADPESSYSYAVHAEPLQGTMVAGVRGYLRLLFAAAAMVLLLACANLAALNLARGRGREGEMAVRSALGAGRWRITRQLITEQVLLAVAGGVCGVLLATWGAQVLSRFVAGRLPRVHEVAVDSRVILFAVLITALSALCAGVVPALRTASLGAARAVKGGRSMPGRLLVAAEVAMAVVLLSAGGLLLRSYQAVVSRDVGFDPDGVATAEVVLAGSRYNDPTVRQRFWEALSSVPRPQDVSAVAYANWIPTGTGGTSYLEIEGAGRDPEGASYRAVSREYFRVLDIDVLRGRAFNARDGAETQRVAVVNRLLADRYWGNAEPIGKRIRTEGMEGYGDQAEWLTIIGVVENIRHDGYEDDVSPQVYVLYSQVPQWTRALHVVAKSSGDGGAAAAAWMTRAVQSLDPQIAAEPVLLADGLRDVISERRLTTGLITAFAALALGLAAIGIYGLLSFSVAERTREMAVRAALGADRRELLSMVLRNGGVVVLAGAAAGVVAAHWLTKLLQSLLTGVTRGDPITYVTVLIAVVAAALVASLVPALRASRADPLSALRSS